MKQKENMLKTAEYLSVPTLYILIIDKQTERQTDRWLDKHSWKLGSHIHFFGAHLGTLLSHHAMQQELEEQLIAAKLSKMT